MSTPSTALPNHRRHMHYIYPHTHSHLYPISNDSSSATVTTTSGIPQNVATTASTVYSSTIPPVSSPLSAAPSAATAAGGTQPSVSHATNLTGVSVPVSASLTTTPATNNTITSCASNNSVPLGAVTTAAYREAGQHQTYAPSITIDHEGLSTAPYPYSHLTSIPAASHSIQQPHHPAPVHNYSQEQQSLPPLPPSSTIAHTAGSYYQPLTTSSVTTSTYAPISYQLPPPISSALPMTTSSTIAAIPSVSSVLEPATRKPTADMMGMSVGMPNPTGGAVHAGHGQDQVPSTQAVSPVVRANSSRQVGSAPYQTQSHSTTVSQSASSSQTPRRRRRKEGGPDWNEFYKNGPPREIIIIVDDDEVPPNTENNNANSGQTTTTYSTQIQPQSGSTHSAKRRRTGDEGLQELSYYDQPTWAPNPAPQYHDPSPHPSVPASVTVADGPTNAQPPKRNPARLPASTNVATSSARKSATGHSTYAHQPGQSQAAQQPPTQPGNIPPAVTTSATGRSATRTTGPTGAPIAPVDVDAEASGQKRKRQTRKSVRDEQRRLEIEATQALQMAGGIMDYIPPSKPPYKAGEVKVPVVVDLTPKPKVDDADGHYVVEEGADLAGRFKIVRLLGQGTFGKVVEAIDVGDRRKRHVAVKIIRSVQKYRDASKIELRVLQTLKQNDKTNRNRCIHLRECFDYRGHICIVTDLLAMSVFDFLKNNGFTPFPSSHIQAFAKQLFTSVAYLHDLNLIHTDLKPENILLVDEDYQTFTYQRTIPSSTTTTNRRATQRKVLIKPEIRLIDFGSATFDDEYHSSVVSTRHYRAPEIILNLGWSFPCDIWSIGCILVEFFTGDALFQTHDNLEHLAMMEAVCGYKIDTRLARQTVQKIVNGQQNGAAKYFTKNRLDYPNSQTSRASKKFVKAMKRLDAFILPNTNFNKQFLDLLRRIFIYDPAKRITAKEALKHPWFNEQSLDDGTEAVRIGIQRRHYQLMKEAEERADADARASGRARPTHSRPAAAPQQTAQGA